MRPPERNGPAFLLEYREDATTAEIAIVKVLRRPNGLDEFRDVWSHSFTNRPAGRVMFDLLRIRPERFSIWGGMAELLGPRFLDGVIDTEIGTYVVPVSGDPTSSYPAAIVTNAPKRIAGDLTMRLVLEGDVPRIVGRFRNRTFLILAAKTVTGVRRIWDWVRWQDGAYSRWADYEQARGAVALVRLILDAMIEQETLMIEAGRVRDPERPLRDWRPFGRRDDT